MQPCSPLGQPGTSSFSFNVPSWSTEYVCGECGVQPWFECCHSSCMIPLRKNVFHTLKQLRAHARHWHAQLASVEETSLVLDTVCCTDDSDSNCSYTHEFEDVQQIDDIPRVDSSLPFSFVKTGTAQFANWCIAGSKLAGQPDLGHFALTFFCSPPFTFKFSCTYIGERGLQIRSHRNTNSKSPYS
jgi:hypothetical protein